MMKWMLPTPHITNNSFKPREAPQPDQIQIPTNVMMVERVPNVQINFNSTKMSNFNLTTAWMK